jgi:hypothetical protein
MVTNVTSRTTSRPPSGAPPVASSGTASAAASESAPRIPLHPTSIRWLRGSASSTRGSFVRTAATRQHEAHAHRHDRARDPERGQQVAVERARGERVEHPRQLQPDEHEQHRVEQERQRVPERLHLHARLGQEHVVGPQAAVEADRHGGEHAGRADRLRRDVRRVGREQRQRDLDLRLLHAVLSWLSVHPIARPIATPPSATSTSRTAAAPSENVPAVAAPTATR